jgi:hypothetical protein
MTVVSLATTNTVQSIKPLSDLQLKDYDGLTFERLEALLSQSKEKCG